MTQPPRRNDHDGHPGARVTHIRPGRSSGARSGGYADSGPIRTLIKPSHHTNHTKQERPAMTGSHPMLIHTIATQRSEEIRAGAERNRLVYELGRENGIPTMIERVRRVVGNALVRTGTLVGGRRAERPVVADRVAAATILRIAR